MPFSYLDIESGKGLGSIKFGFTKEDVASLMGYPEEKEVYELNDDADYKTESWHYDEYEIALSFVQFDEWRLVSITSSFEESLLFGKEVVGMKKKQLVKLLERNDISDIQYENCSSDDVDDLLLAFSMTLGMNFWLEEGLVTDVEFGIKYDDNEEPIWPSKE